MSNVTELATGQLNGTASIVIELIEADETPAVVIIRWPSKRADAEADAGDRTYLVLAKPNVIMNDIRLRGLARSSMLRAECRQR